MSYLGNAPARSFISFERQVFSIVNSQTAYALSHSVTNENDIRLVVNNVVQEPGSGKAYTATGTALTLSAALTNGTDEMYCVFLGRATATNAPGAGSVGTVQLADNATTLAKMASGTDGNIISYDTSGNPVAVATGSAGQFLKSAGAGAVPSFATIPAGGSIVKLQTQTASSSSTITFSSTYLTTTYKKYYLDYTDIVISSDGGNIAATVSENNGSSYTTSGYLHWRIISTSGTSNNTIASSGNDNNSSLLMLGTGVGLGTGADESGSGRMTIFNPFSADAKFFICEGLNFGSSAQLVQQTIYQGLLTSTIINNIKITPNTGTIVSGIFTLYGVTT